MASEHCLCIPTVLLLVVDWREVGSGWCTANLVDKGVVTRNESCVDEGPSLRYDRMGRGNLDVWVGLQCERSVACTGQMRGRRWLQEG